MNALKIRLIKELIDREGGYVNDPTDRGGETMYGITKVVARDFGYTGEMQDMPYQTAFLIQDQRYWSPLKLSKISVLSESLAEQLFDFAVHSGVSTSAKALQKALNVLNKCQSLYPDLVVDGIPGSRTISALTDYAAVRKNRGLDVLAEAVRGQRISFCIDIAANDESQEKYQFGWLDRIVNL
ncbi:glycoside hydrolase family 108 protein [Pseudoalteromonas lipolytica]|uniref:glycoside hydrolase family 108 protein n=1 Tax=Pseudoalteromonas lipolytica TaxID=570156 RepID=UPI0008255FC0|nr:N-acetylmuramidase [Pseudoalteromonas lipolytica]